MNTIGAAIDRGEIEVYTMTWELFDDCGISLLPCNDCEFVRRTKSMVCTLFDFPYNSVEPEATVPTSLVSLISVIYWCSLKRRKA